MNYLVDGHNLIPKLGLKLEALDDEEQLLSRLREFCRLRRARVEVFFDGAPPGQPASRGSGALIARFVRKGSTADAALEKRLADLGKAARNWTVVSSDGRVQRAAQAVHAAVLSSEEFAGEISRAQAIGSTRLKTETTLPSDQVEEWLELFKARPPRS